MIAIAPIGFVHGGRKEPIDDAWETVAAEIRFDPARFSADATAGLADFSHVLVIYLFHLVADEEIETGARHPRGRTDWPKVGIFAQRGKGRPNRLGVSTAELVAVDGLTLRLRGLDAVDGTPVLDVKPYFSAFAPRSAVREPAWVAEIMRNYW